MPGMRIYDERRYRLFGADRPENRPLDTFIEFLLTPFEGLYETGALVLEIARKGFECVAKVFEALEVSK